MTETEDTAHLIPKDGEKKESPRKENKAEEAPAAPLEGQLKTLIVLMIAICISQFTYMNVVALLPDYIKAHYPNFSSIAVGILLAIYPLGFFFMAIVAGAYQGRIGRKNMVLYSVIGLTIGDLLFAFAAFIDNDIGFYAVSAIGRLIQGSSDALVNVVAFAIVAIEYPEKAELYCGWISVALGMGNCLGPFIGSFVQNFAHYQGTMFFFAGVVFVFGLPLACCLPSRLNNVTQQEEDTEEQEEVPFSKFLTSGKAFIVTLTLVNSFMCFIFFEPTMAPALTSPPHNLSQTEAGNIFTLLAFTFAAAAPLIGWLSEVISPYHIYGASLFFLSLSDFLVGPSEIFPNDAFLIIIGVGLIGIFVSGTFVPSIPMLISAVHDEMNSEKEKAGKPKAEEPSTEASDKSAAVAMMCYSFG